jgi:hypothetical protein
VSGRMSTVSTRPSDRTYAPRAFDSIASSLDTTMTGGTALLVGFETPIQPTDEYVLLRSEVILEYEQMISDLRRQLIHYKRLVAHLSGPREGADDYDSTSVVLPIDAQSIKVVNSIVQAHIPQSAIFREFDEGEL